MLRAASRQKVTEILEATFFGIDNYSIEFGGSEGRVFRIFFIPNSSFQFRMMTNESGQVWCVESPGIRFLTAETATVPSVETGMTRINSWAKRIQEELVALNPFAKEIADLKTHVDERLANLGDQLNGFFSQDEANLLTEKLTVFSERLNTISSKNAELEEAVKVLRKTVEDLVEAASTVNRGTWYRMAGGRLLSGMKSLGKSKEAREFALEAAKKFLLEGPR
jgi:uncharacterized phage infection (PIP) family protein YhgE